MASDLKLSDRIAALSAPDRAIDAEIARAFGLPHGQFSCRTRAGAYYEYGERAKEFTESIDAALTLASPALQAHTMAEAQKLLGPRGFTVGKFTEALAIAICVVALRGKGL